ncbi:SAM-dependent methyltransferase [Nocardiopsis sp. NPDC006139]|uniref:SAM-dependent methyltransferase n=1 Tax=Nocardiopsis changdeensis TaxID=2831969 RepID=A0ABX8BGE8_9ACTN|nr:SAM-dependent methyltransferase [Nocardiopsis changdeensis]QYX37247.1 SAM-dependent methyltransferase [Nocardiopsis sp. MT53]
MAWRGAADPTGPADGAPASHERTGWGSVIVTDVRGNEAGPLRGAHREPVRRPARGSGVVDLRGRPPRPSPEPDEAARRHTAFLDRVTAYLCADAGTGQFVDWGCPVPGLAAMVRAHRPGARVVHVAPPGVAGTLASSDGAVVSSEGGPSAALHRLATSGLVDLDEPVAVLMTRPFPADAPPGGIADLYGLLRGGGHLALASTAPHQVLLRALAPFHPVEPGAADLVWWPYPDEDVAARGSGILGALGRAPARGGGGNRWRR